MNVGLQRRQQRHKSPPIPIYRIDEAGSATQIAEIHLQGHEGCYVSLNQAFNWPLLQNGRHHEFAGVPYFIDDMRPQGFLGRQFASRLAKTWYLPETPSDWSDDDILVGLGNFGYDQVGDLIIGEGAYHRFLSYIVQGQQYHREEDIPRIYPLLADQAMSGAAVGAMVGGEFPKFTAGRLMNDKPQQVIVKFSQPDGTLASQRWADLLICEHISSCILMRELGINAASSHIYQAGGRTFLETARFDRHGAFGRSAVCSLAMIDAYLLGLAGDPWPASATGLLQVSCLDAASVVAINKIWYFGRLIANTDMHGGNLSFQPGLKVAPVYDMLPMAYAPQWEGVIADRDYLPQLPAEPVRKAWLASANAAIAFWRQASCDERISGAFRSICRINGERLASAMEQA